MFGYYEDMAYPLFLKAVVERERVGYLWEQAHDISPRLLRKVFGDGQQLIGLTTINSRPNYYVIRGHSGWELSNWECGDLFIDHEEEVLEALEEEFGYSHCPECGERYGTGEDCGYCEDATEDEGEWPTVDADGGRIWFAYQP